MQRDQSLADVQAGISIFIFQGFDQLWDRETVDRGGVEIDQQSLNIFYRSRGDRLVLEFANKSLENGLQLRVCWFVRTMRKRLEALAKKMAGPKPIEIGGIRFKKSPTLIAQLRPIGEKPPQGQGTQDQQADGCGPGNEGRSKLSKPYEVRGLTNQFSFSQQVSDRSIR